MKQESLDWLKVHFQIRVLQKLVSVFKSSSHFILTSEAGNFQQRPPNWTATQAVCCFLESAGQFLSDLWRRHKGRVNSFCVFWHPDILEFSHHCEQLQCCTLPSVQLILLCFCTYERKRIKSHLDSFHSVSLCLSDSWKQPSLKPVQYWARGLQTAAVCAARSQHQFVETLGFFNAVVNVCWV